MVNIVFRILSQLKKSCELVYRALVDGTRMRDAWRENMWHLCWTELQRFLFAFVFNLFFAGRVARENVAFVL